MEDWSEHLARSTLGEVGGFQSCRPRSLANLESWRLGRLAGFESWRSEVKGLMYPGGDRDVLG